MKSTRDKIMDEALTLYTRGGRRELTRANVAANANVADSLVFHYFGDVDSLRHAVIEECIDRALTRGVAFAILEKDPAAESCPPELRLLASEEVLK